MYKPCGMMGNVIREQRRLDECAVMNTRQKDLDGSKGKYLGNENE